MSPHRAPARTTGRPAGRWVEEIRDDRREWWTRTAGALPPIYGERWRERRGEFQRAWDPHRSKLAAALEVGWTGALPAEGERWLYLGAASGTTTSHVADLVGASGLVYAIERSPRPFRRLLGWVERWPNVAPILADARRPDEYAMLVPIVDGLYADIAQADQVEIVIENARRRLRDGGALLLALKTASMGREASAPAHLQRALDQLDGLVELDAPVRLHPFHRGHYLVSGTARPGFARLALTPRPAPASPALERRSPHPRLSARDRGRPSDRGTARSGPRPGRRGRIS